MITLFSMLGFLLTHGGQHYGTNDAITVLIVVLLILLVVWVVTVLMRR